MEPTFLKKYYQLGWNVNIGGDEFIGPFASYAGSYTSSNAGGRAPVYTYYLNGNSDNQDVPHFTTGNTNGGQGTFKSFHITVYYQGSNAAVWYIWNGVSTDITRDKILYPNMPSHKLDAFEVWMNGQLAVLDQMAIQFWDQLDPPQQNLPETTIDSSPPAAAGNPVQP